MFILDSIPNARELGGYTLPGGRVVKHDLLLRGGSLNGISDDDILLLRDKFKLKKIFDFRTGTEVRMMPDREIPDARRFWMPAFNEETMHEEKLALPHGAYKDLGGWLVEHASLKSTQEVARKMYTTMVTNEFTQIQYAGFLQNIVGTADGAVYWHCSQGKDRTGLAAAFVLAALGADRDTIMKDYAISGEYYRKDLDLYIDRVSSPEEKAAMRTFISVNCDYFADALDEIDRKWGSMANYLSGPLCLSDDDMDIMQKRYLE